MVQPGPIPDPLHDPALDAHVEEMQRLAELVEAVQGEPPAEWTPQTVAAARREMEAYAPSEPEITSRFVEREIPGPRRPITLRIHVPDVTVRAVSLDFHGGGFFIGMPAMSDLSAIRHGESWGAVMVSAQYGLGPEEPYPAGPDDAEAAALWLLENAEAEFGAPLRVIGGASSGANIAAVTLLRLRDRHDAAEGFAAANLVFGVFDMTGTPSQHRRGVPSFRDLYLPDLPRAERLDPDISPLYADLHDLPPALFTVGTADYLFDDSLFMAARWHAAGNEAEVRIYPECPHGFTAFPAELARIANDAVEDWVRDRLDRV